MKSILIPSVMAMAQDYKIKLDESNKLKVIQITDIHYGEDEKDDILTTREMKKLFDWEKPDLAILTGDMVSNYAWDGTTKPWYEVQWNKWTEAFIEKGLPYMYIQGNHDALADLDRDEVATLDMTNDFSLTEKGPAEIHGTSNYVKTVYDSTGENKMFYLWAFDSMSENCEGVKGWGCVYPDAIEWYRQKSQELIEEDGKILPGYAFFHIPLPEYMDMYNTQDIFGVQKEEVCCFSVNTGLYSAFKEMGNMEATFCGHDHNNDYWGDHYGIKLHFGRKTGHGGYGPAFGLKRGARMLEFSVEGENVDLKTWIREEDGQILEQQPLKPNWRKTKQNACCGMQPEEVDFILSKGFSLESELLDFI